MIPLDHPHVRAYLTAARSDLGHACGFADWLQEQEEGLPTLCWWLSRCEDADLPAVQAALAAWERAQGRQERAGQVEGMNEDVKLYAKLFTEDFDAQRALLTEAVMRGFPDGVTDVGRIVEACKDKPAVQEANARALTTVRRDLRRRILGLFPEVEVRVRFSISDREFQDIAKSGRAREIQRRLGSAGFHPDRLHDYWDDVSQRRRHFAQTLRAPDLIPADKSEPTPADWPANPTGTLAW